MSTALTTQEEIRDLQIQVERLRDQVRAEEIAKNDALLLVEKANADRDEALEKAKASEQRADEHVQRAGELAAQVEGANTAAAQAVEVGEQAVEAAKDAAENLAAEREDNKRLRTENEALRTNVTNLQAQVDEARPKLEAIDVLNLRV